MSRVLITGAASGLGAALAQEAAKEGHQLFLVDISPSVEQISKETTGQFLVIDLNDPKSAEQIHSWAPNIDILINNAAMAFSSPLTDLNPETAAKILHVNALAPMLLSRVYLPGFRKNNHGVIVNISSSAAYFPTPGLAAYGASKAFLSAFTEALIEEVADCPGVKVIGFCPSGMATNFQKSSGVKNPDSSVLLDPSHVAQRVLTIAFKGRSGIYNYGASTHAIKLLKKFLPENTFRFIMGRLMLRYR